MIAPTFSGTKRYKILRKLGEGGMGAVYECQDIETGAHIALKTLLFSAASTLLRFKDEFREFQGIHHPNLVSLGELFEEEGLWHFTMELVRGRDFMTHVRPGTFRRPSERPSSRAETQEEEFTNRPVMGARGTHVDDRALRMSLAQLGKGLVALHEAGKVHRDIKPSNILVTTEGRVVLLDFGIATGIARSEQLTQYAIVGTPDYMAPEQAVGAPVSAATDWYAVGTMIYEALTGKLPFEGTLLQVLQAKQKSAPVPVRNVTPTAAEDLATLAMDLLATQPKDRPTAEEVLHRLGVPDFAVPKSVPKSIGTDTQATPFVGRDIELQQLEAAMKRVTDQREAVAVYVHGESGIGKSALVRRFTDIFRMNDPNAVVLAGACYEHEAVPYKALDGVVDALSRYLVRLQPAVAAALLPRHATALAQAFPVLGRVEAFAASPRTRAIIDPVEQRTRVFGALRELLARIADRSPVLVTIDDFQWADIDSRALLGEILRKPDSPNLLVVATVRLDGRSEESVLPIGPTGRPELGTTLSLERLSNERAKEIAEALTRRVGAAAPVDIQAIVNEARGYPLFLHELVRYHATNPSQVGNSVGLDEALWSRIEALDEPTQRLLQVTSLAPASLMQGTATAAAEIPSTDAIRYVKHLKAAHLVRTTGGTRATDLIEPYHAAVRAAVSKRINAETKRQLHRRLALAMETSGVKEPEQLAIHWREAGDMDRAAENARRAAARAEEALAFGRAAEHYRMVDEMVDLGPAERRTLLVQLGTALANAGHSQAAAKVYREASQGASPSQARDLSRRSAEHLLRSGHIEEGLVELKAVLSAFDIAYPESPRAAIASLLWSQAKLKLRGLSFRLAEEASVAPELLARIDACWAAATGLFVADQLRGVDFELRHLLLALSAGEPSRVIRGLAFHACSKVAMNPQGAHEARKILESARTQLRIHNSPHARASVASAEGTVTFLCGEFESSVERGIEAINLLRSECRGVAWELASARQIVFWSLAYMGRLEQLALRAHSSLRETIETSDYYAAMSIRSGMPNVVWLAQDDPVRARHEADEAIGPWARHGTLLQHLMDLVGQSNIDAYEGKGQQAWQRVEGARANVSGSGLTRVEFNRVLFGDAECRSALCAAAQVDQRDRAPYVSAVESGIASLSKENAPWSRALAECHRATLAILLGQPDAKDVAARAADELCRVNLTIYAAALARTAGLTTHTTYDWFGREKIVNPSRFARVFAPGSTTE